MLVIIQHNFLFGESRLKWRPVAATSQQTAPYLVTSLPQQRTTQHKAQRQYYNPTTNVR